MHIKELGLTNLAYFSKLNQSDSTKHKTLIKKLKTQKQQLSEKQETITSLKDIITKQQQNH